VEDGGRITIDRATQKLPPGNLDADGRWIARGVIAYVRVPSFRSPSVERSALDRVSEFRDAKTLIIDMRGNAGGLVPCLLIRALTDRPYHSWKRSISPGFRALLSAKKGNAGSHLESSSDSDADVSVCDRSLPKSVSPVEAGNPHGFHGRLILLIDGGCFSACEELVQPFKDNHRATLIGETTQGGSGEQYFYDFGNGMKVRISAVREYFPDGSEFEGVGIKPDFEVKLTIQDLKSGKDRVLEKALEIANNPRQ